MHRRVEPVEILALFYLAARGRSPRVEFSIITYLAKFVNRKIAQKFQQFNPKILLFAQTEQMIWLNCTKNLYIFVHFAYCIRVIDVVYLIHQRKGVTSPQQYRCPVASRLGA